jgi:capsular exopolysaccharide synthesis family protein
MAQKEVHLRDYLVVIHKHDFLVFLSVLIILGSALIVGLHIPKTYEASALILVYPNTNFNRPSDNLFQSMLSGGANRTEMETINRRLFTESLLQSVIESFEQHKVKGVEYLPSVGVLKRRIHAEIVPDTRFINVSIRMKEQEGGERNAAIFINKLVEMLQNVLDEEQSSEAQLRMSVIKKELDALKASLSEQEQKLLAFMKQYGIPNLWYEQLSQKLTERRDVVEQKEQVYAALSNSEIELDKLQKELENYPELVEYSRTISDNPLWIKQVTDLDDIEVKIADTKARLGPESPGLKGLEAQKREREARLQNYINKTTSSITQTLSPTHLSLLDSKINAEINILRAKNRLQQCDARLEKVDGELAQLISSIPETQFKFNQIAKEIDSLYDMSRELYKQKIEAQMLMGRSEYDGSNLSNRPKGGISVVDKAQPQKIPVSPRLLFIAAIATIVGISVGLATAFMLDYFDNTYHSPEEVKNDLDIPLLGSLPINFRGLLKSEGRDKVKRKQGLFRPVLKTLGESETDFTLMLPVEDEPTSQIAESYRALAINIGFACHGMNKPAIMIISSYSDDSKSYAVANLGVAMAQAKGPVIIIDCNLKSPIQHKIFSLSENEFTQSSESERDRSTDLVGLYDLLTDNAQINEAIQNTRVFNLDLIASGPVPLNPSGLLNSPKITEIIEHLKSSYNVVICDGPPVLQMSDGLVLASKLDGTILVVDLEQTSKDVLRHTKEQLHQSGVTLLGLICI